VADVPAGPGADAGQPARLRLESIPAAAGLRLRQRLDPQDIVREGLLLEVRLPGLHPAPVLTRHEPDRADVPAGQAGDQQEQPNKPVSPQANHSNLEHVALKFLQEQDERKLSQVTRASLREHLGVSLPDSKLMRQVRVTDDEYRKMLEKKSEFPGQKQLRV